MSLLIKYLTDFQLTALNNILFICYFSSRGSKMSSLMIIMHVIQYAQPNNIFTIKIHHEGMNTYPNLPMPIVLYAKVTSNANSFPMV